ncbi:GNAT family N-acetyltransferase [Rhizobiaceae bacterium n13]|uniref:GNAT family N-acetyltransferase n=1 Tax=Ferirhizobium litorale TaxID=2927786 RepID=A0AAE3QJH1_9HYPH|nr:GNAT family N-acetyltransferase [Fererhizobium litorale]MDI7864406.1 GNAT family N-acetyltransferase [Fererhizobium litorale]MDI7924680.1 GNAT family N-acetyltransferase [Fererhizobium litorale]
MYFVRTASERDLPQVRAMLDETWHSTYDPIFGAEKVNALLEAWYSPAALKERLARKDAEFLVADDGRNIGGMGFAALSRQMAKTVNLHMLYVRPSLHRQGIGRDIFAELETCFPGAEIMRLEVVPENGNAITFYKAHGFHEVGSTENCGKGRSGIPALIFEKKLAG